MQPTMGVDEAIRARRSVRGFRPEPVSDALIREAFELAQWAPSNCNVQPWSPHVASGSVLSELRAELIAAAERAEPINPDYPADYDFRGIYRERQIDAARQLYAAMGVARGRSRGPQARVSAQLLELRGATRRLRVHA